MRADLETYTHGHAASVLRSHASRTVADSAAYLIPFLRPGARVLDVGCGPGTITADLAARVAPGPVLGIEPTPGPLADARAHAAAVGAENAAFALGDVYALDHPDDAFDVVHAHQVLQHLGDPVAALGEMLRVCAPDGIVAARDADYAATIPSGAHTRSISRSAATGSPRCWSTWWACTTSKAPSGWSRA